MAKVASRFLFLFFLSLLTVCSSGTLVGFSYNARGDTVASSLGRTLSILKLNKVPPSCIRVFGADHRALSSLSNSSVSIDLYLNESLIENLINSESSAISWLKTQVVAFLPHVNIKSITVSSNNDLSRLLYTLKSFHSVLSSFHLDKEVKISVAFSLSFLENLNRAQENELHEIFEFIRKTRSFVIVEASIDIYVELVTEDIFFQLMIQKATLATSFLPSNDVPIVMTIKGLFVPSAKEVVEFTDKLSKFLGNIQISAGVAELYAQVSPAEDFANKELRREQEQIFQTSRRELLNNFKTTLHDTLPTTIFPTTPVTPPVTLLPDNPTPTIVTVPATNPVSVTPANPVSTPIPVPSTTPVTVPSTNPSVNPPLSVTNPVTTPAPITVPGAQPITNPVTTYPAPAGNIPVTTPVTNPVSPPATTNTPAVPGQSWCLVKSGALETALQSALDYACGMGGADCSQIQQGGSCYNPNTLQNHASYAFNSYYQKNPSPTSCDFGGTATIVNINPSTGSCIYPSSSSSSSTSSIPAPTTSSANPTTTTSPPSTGASSTPPSVLNSGNPAPVFGSETPPGISTSTSKSATLQLMISYIILLASIVGRIILMDM